MHAVGSCLVDPEIGAAGDVDTAAVLLKTASRQDRADLEFAPRHLWLRPAHRGAWQPAACSRPATGTPRRSRMPDASGYQSDPALPFFLERYARSLSARARRFRRIGARRHADRAERRGRLEGAAAGRRGDAGRRKPASRCASHERRCRNVSQLAVAVAREAGALRARAYTQPPAARRAPSRDRRTMSSSPTREVERVIRARAARGVPEGFVLRRGRRRRVRARRLDGRSDRRHREFRARHSALVHLDRLRARRRDRDRRDLSADHRRDVCGAGAAPARC